MTESVQVERSAVRTWMLALLGIPFMLLGADMFFEQKLIRWLGDLIYGTEELPAFESRDWVLATLLLLGGTVLTLWGLKELVFPRKLLVADAEGLHLTVAGPFRPSVTVPWDEIAGMRYEVVGDEGEPLPVVTLEVADPARLPVNPWGARWSGQSELMIDAKGWSPPAEAAVDALWRLHDTGSEPGVG